MSMTNEELESGFRSLTREVGTLQEDVRHIKEALCRLGEMTARCQGRKLY